MLVKLNQIIIFGLIAFALSILLYPRYIKLLKKCKAGQQLREDDISGKEAKIFNKLHCHKKGTPNMGGGMFLLIMAVMIGISIFVKNCTLFEINNTLLSREETYILLFGFFSMGFLGILDDILNARSYGKIKGLSAKAKLIGMFIFSAFISRWFYSKLGIDYINFWPIAGKIHLGLFAPLITFFVTISIVNAINITDGLDGLAGGLISIILFTLGIITFTLQTYISTAVLGILIATLLSFMLFNINPAKIFMGDGGAFALGGFLSSLLFLLNMRIGILLPFIILFALFIIEISSSALQMGSKKYLKKKLFSVAPLHHYFENNGVKETTIVMKARLIQGILAAIALIGIFYQFNGGVS